MLGTLTVPARNPFCSSPEINRFSSVRSPPSTPTTARGFTNRRCTVASVCASPEVDSATATATGTRRPGSLYEVLRVKRTASPTEIKTAYRSLAKMYHPDAVRSDGQDFMEIHNAYATLSDPAARALYDLSLGAQFQRRPFEYSAARNRSGFYPTRRWETDQCW